jgi:hypothetical protein
MKLPAYEILAHDIEADQVRVDMECPPDTNLNGRYDSLLPALSTALNWVADPTW